MGNRAVLQFGGGTEGNVMGIYLHWNGGEESVQAFLDAAKQLDVRVDGCYEIARLCQIIGNFFGGTLSLGVGLAKNLDRNNGDNGTYIIEGLNIKKRLFRPGVTEGWTFDNEQYKGILAVVLERNRPLFKEVA